MIIDPAGLDAAQNYKLLIGSILPRPIAWVSTRSVDGVDNLAPVSFFTAAGRKRPRIHVSLQTRSDGVGLPPYFVQHISDVAHDHREGVFAGVNNLVEVISGTKPATVDEYVAATRSLFDTDGLFAMTDARLRTAIE
jgi:flavin reductase (DIM6/NTAB) family NADH-FMN oxidoreductase RutF